MPNVENPSPDMDLACDVMHHLSSMMQKATEIQDEFRSVEGLQQMIALISGKESVKVQYNTIVAQENLYVALGNGVTSSTS